MNRKELALAMARYANQTLTPEVGRAILAAAFGSSRAIDTAQFHPEGMGEYVIQAEPFAQLLPELTPLHEAHWQETENWRAGIPMNPNYEAICERERLGRLLQVTLRHNGTLVGHLRMYLNESLHTQTLYAEEDTLYITPEHRGGFLAIKMIRWMERCVRTLGVREIRANSKLVNRVDVLMKRAGYETVAFQYCKVFGAQEAAPFLTEGLSPCSIEIASTTAAA